MKAALLIIELKYPLEHCQQELNAVLGRLPEGCKRVLHADKSVGILIPPYKLPVELNAILHSALIPFANHRIFGLSGETFCKHGSMDLIEGWMDQYRPEVFRSRQGPKPQHVPLTQRRKPGRKPSV